MDIKTNQKIEEASASKEPALKHRARIISYLLAAVAFLVAWFLMRFQAFDRLSAWRPIIQRFCLAAFVVFLILIAARAIERSVTRQNVGGKAHYNLVRLIRLLSVLLALSVLVTFIFEKWYTAVVSLGLVSLILGFALQTPISSLIGWFYIIIRTPYRIGDRIQVGTFTGDVVEISYLDTTLWEFGGDYLTNDLPSGRLIRFPNTMVLQAEVYNYSWKKFPYIWNEIPFHVAYESDLAYVAETVRKVATEVLGPETAAQIEKFKELVEQTPVDELDIKEYPFVVFRTNANTWLEVSLTYLVPPKKASQLRSLLIQAIVQSLLKAPDKVMFPKSNAR